MGLDSRAFPPRSRRTLGKHGRHDPRFRTRLWRFDVPRHTGPRRLREVCVPTHGVFRLGSVTLFHGRPSNSVSSRGGRGVDPLGPVY